MRIALEGVIVFDETYPTTEALVDQYRDEELKNGREVPRYAWEALALVVGEWLLKKAADEVYKWVVEYRKRQKDSQEKEALRTLNERRHQELVEKLDKIISALQSKPADNTEWLRSVLTQGQLTIEIDFVNDAEADFIPAFEKKLNDLGNKVVLSHKDKTT